MVTVNGRSCGDIEGVSVGEFLAAQGYRSELVAVELNGVILPRAEYDDTTLKNGDRLEVVSFVGGG